VLDDGIYRIPLAGGTASKLSDVTGCTLGALANGALYCISMNGLQSIDLGSGQPTVLLTTKDSMFSVIAVDGKTIYGYSQEALMELDLL